MLGDVLLGMRTKFQVDTFENDVRIAFETSKIATFHGNIPMHYLSSNYFFVSTSCSMRPTRF